MATNRRLSPAGNLTGGVRVGRAESVLRRSEKAARVAVRHASATQESERRIAARSQIEDKSTEALGRRVGSRIKQGRVTDRPGLDESDSRKTG